jgi:cation transport protein ChaC
MWDPGFGHIESHPARIYGFHRRLCLWSIRYRGTEEQPGLVLGLDRGGSCRGVAFKISNRNIDDAIEYLYDREMISGSYSPVIKPVYLQNGDVVQALTFISIIGHPQYAHRMDTADLLSIIREAKGHRGTNIEYLVNTVKHLDELGISNTELHRIAAAL